MKRIIIGSHALREYVDGIVPMDVDIIVKDINEAMAVIEENNLIDYLCDRIPSHKFNCATLVVKKEAMILEITYPTDKNSTWFDLLSMDIPTKSINIPDLKGTFDVPPIDVLYTIKMSHRYLKNSPSFNKTRNDIMLMRENGADIFNQNWYEKRINETYDYAHPLLNISKSDFFKDDNVPYTYDHDSIHNAVALMANPAYKSYMKDGSEVMTSKEKFFECPIMTRLCGVYEESCVLALERSQIPNNFKIDPTVSFMIALEKVCTSITSGWFREFAWENYHVIVEMYKRFNNSNYDYVTSFMNALSLNMVKKHGE